MVSGRDRSTGQLAGDLLHECAKRSLQTGILVQEVSEPACPAFLRSFPGLFRAGTLRRDQSFPGPPSAPRTAPALLEPLQAPANLPHVS